MEESLLYDLLDKSLIFKWRDEIEEADPLNYRREGEAAKRRILEIAGDELAEPVKSLEWNLYMRYDYLIYELGVKIFKLGIKLGADLQKIIQPQNG